LLINILAYLNDLRFVIFINLIFEISSSVVFSLSVFLSLLSLLFFLKQSSVLISFKMSMSIIFLIEKKNSCDFKIVFFNYFLFCWLHFQFNDLTNLTMCSHSFQSCMFLYKHCRFSLLSLFVEIENVDFCDWDWDWDCDWFWRVTTLTCSTIFNFFFDNVFILASRFFEMNVFFNRFFL
jgi:hypothetical protein